MDGAPGDAGRGGERDRPGRSGSAAEEGVGVPVHRREALPAEAARDLVWRRLAPLSKDSELVRGDQVLGEMSQATRVGFDAWGECLGESWDLRFDWRLFGSSAVACDPETGERGVELSGLFLLWGKVRVPGEEQRFRWHTSPAGAGTEILDARGRSLVRLRTSFFRFFRTETRVEVAPALVDSPLLPRFLLLAWFARQHVERGLASPRFRRVKG